MRARQVLASVAVMVAALATGMPSPAFATPAAPVISGLATSPGHVTGTVSSPGAPYVYLRLKGSPPSEFVLTADSGTFDVTTWGYSGTQSLYVMACTTADLSDCSATVASADSFTVVDVSPQVTWSSDTTIGPGENASVTVDDSGGGQLFASATPTLSGVLQGASVSVAAHGTTLLSFPDGSLDIHLLRCSDTDVCTDLPPPEIHHYEIHHHVQISWQPLPWITTSHPSTALTISTDRTGTYDLDWHVELNGHALADPHGSVVGQSLDGSGSLAPINIDGSALLTESDSYQVVATLTVHDPIYGDYPATPVAVFSSVPTFGIDRTPPVVDSYRFYQVGSSKSVTTLYPNVNTPDRPGRVAIQVNASGFSGVDVKAPNGNVVTTIWNGFSPIWNGRDRNGVTVPSGRYQIVAIDSVGNEASTVGYLSVDSRHRELRTWSQTLKADSHLLSTYVGKCSTLRRPSARRWKGSLGYYSNTKCGRQAWHASAVSTLYGIYLPSAVDADVDVRVYVYGGAAKSRPTSRAGLRYLSNKGGWYSWKVLSPKLGLHQGVADNDRTIYPDRAFYWGLATEAGDRFDVKYFKVTLRYYVLV